MQRKSIYRILWGRGVNGGIFASVACILDTFRLNATVWLKFERPTFPSPVRVQGFSEMAPFYIGCLGKLSHDDMLPF